MFCVKLLNVHKQARICLNICKNVNDNPPPFLFFSVRTDLLVNGAQSRLHIAGATYTDSGNAGHNNDDDDDNDDDPR